jgi:hypothetical protein
MRSILLSCLVLTLSANAFAHRLDEYLQATRIALATNRIDLSIDLTPGATVAEHLLGLIDNDQDGQLSESERSDYARHFLKDLQLKLDEKPLPLNLVDVSFPEPLEVRAGVGVIRLRASASLDPLAMGNHTLSLCNGHLPAIIAYLVNALKPKDAAIQVNTQTRDELQKNYRLSFDVTAAQKR